MVSLIKERRTGLTGLETFLEVGTGRSLALPIALWVSGAKQIITVDIHRYLREELVLEQLHEIRNNCDLIAEWFAPLCNETFSERWALLLDPDMTLERLLSIANIRYIAPADASCLDLQSGSVDFHVSFWVLQHVRPSAIGGIFLEGKRLLKPDGLFVHYAVLGDLFSGVDPRISHVNFLQYSDEEWESIAGNRFMYHNRLRVDDFTELLQKQGLHTEIIDQRINTESLRLLEDRKLRLDSRFKNKNPETNATESIWIVANSA